MDYKQSGVDIDGAGVLTELIKNTVKSDNIGMFAGLYSHPYFPEYFFAACTDGVGTKVIPLIERNMVGTIAVDLIAMNLNDLVCVGAVPLFFLDYFATNKLNVDLTAGFIKALQYELKKYNCTLLGGETAELSDLVTSGHFDVAGFSVGLVKKDNLLTKTNVALDDLVVGLKSSGPHSNGYTLIRKLFDNGKLTLNEYEETLNPTNIYVNEIMHLNNNNAIKVCAHITGGGLEENLARVIPDGLCADICKSNIPESHIFNKLKQLVGEEEAFKTFNMGVGMAVVVSTDKLDRVVQVCSEFEPFVLGRIIDEKNHRVRLR